jgi:hypothetical protein
MNPIKKYWNDHGTKVLGTASATLGAAQVAISSGLMDVSKGWKNTVAIGVIVLGTGTLKRGFTNTRNLNAPTVPPA